MHLFVEIEREAETCTGRIHEGNPTFARTLETLALRPEDTVVIDGRNYPLGELTERLIAFQSADLRSIFDERGQLAIGRHLFSQVFGGMPPSERQRLGDSGALRVHILSADEHIRRLPWTLLADEHGVFLLTEGWAVTPSPGVNLTDCDLPPSPTIVVAAPEPEGVPPTFAEAHLRKLEDLLSSADPRMAIGRHIKLVQTWEEFCIAVRLHNPDIVYYYGHGAGDSGRSRLIFEDAGRQPDETPVRDVEIELSNLDRPPRLAYFNCCHGDSGGHLGICSRLVRLIPALVSNRTVAMIPAAQGQALSFFEAVLLRGEPPHTAINGLYGSMTDLGLSTADVRWMTPVLHTGYRNWRASPPPPLSREIHDPDWEFKVDRVGQFGEVAYRVRQMITDGKFGVLAFVWYGEEGQGHDAFHERLDRELRGELPETAHFHPVRPQWPDVFLKDDEERGFEAMLLRAFKVERLEDIPGRIRGWAGGADRQTLVYVRHLPIRKKKRFNPRLLRLYIDWWDRVVAPLLEPRQHILLGISFVVAKPPAFQKLVLDREGMMSRDHRSLSFHLLDRMERLAREHLIDFFRTHNVRLPIRHRERIIDEVFAETDGRYEATIEALKARLDRAWASDEEETGETEADEYDEDY